MFDLFVWERTGVECILRVIMKCLKHVQARCLKMDEREMNEYLTKNGQFIQDSFNEVTLQVLFLE